MTKTRTINRFLILTLTALVIPYEAGAMELGDIQLNSYLNQSLKAQITVQPSEGNDMDKVHIGLAPQAAFDKAGITRSSALDLIKFQLMKEKDGKSIIKLTSQKPIKEPFLDFILEMSSPKEHVMREYTVLLDAPVNSPETAPPADAGVATTPSGQAAAGPATRLQDASSPASSPAIATRSIEPKLTPDGYGPTMRPNTLWVIAQALRPDESVSIEQEMLALVNKNPEAFYHSNVNELKAGYFLHKPDKALIMQVSKTDAAREVKLEYQRWLQSKQGQPSSAAVAAPKSDTGDGEPKAKSMDPDAT